MPVQSGNQLDVANTNTTLRIVEVEHQRGSTRVTAREWADNSVGNAVADPGRSLPGSDLTIGETRLILADLPAFGTEDPGRATIVAAAAGTGAGWRRAALSLVEGERIIELGGTKGVSIIGQLLGGLPSHTALLEDRMNQPIIRLLHDNMVLPAGSGDPKCFDAPSIWLNGEIIRYGNAEKIGPRKYQLNLLLRGCFGTESSANHPSQANVFLIESESLLLIDSVPTPINAMLQLEAQGIGDTEPVGQSILAIGNAIRPRKPVHGKIERLENGDYQLQWHRRDRLTHGWSDGADIPNSEGVNDYAVELYTGGALRATWTTGTSALQITTSEIAGLLIPSGTNLQFQIVEIGRFARSLPLILVTNM